jgi:methyltransferase-like protein 6
VHDFEWTSEMEQEAKKIVEENEEILEEHILNKFLNTQDKNWEKFYKFNKTNFFKDRHYILREFKELAADQRVR